VRGERAIGFGIAVIVLCVVAVAIGWSVVRGEAQDQQAGPLLPPPADLAARTGSDEGVGRYQFGAPDLILDTATGKLTNGSGQVLESPIDASGKDAGRYSVAGYVTAVTRTLGLDVLNQPTVQADLVKGYVIGDTKTGRIVKQRVYHSGPLQPGEL